MQNIKTDELKTATSETLAKEIAKILIEKKALGVRLYNVKGTNAITDYYVNVTGMSSTHVSSLADEVVHLIGMRGRDALHVEGRSGVSWILVDFGDVIVNVFDKPSREFYNFDRFLPEEGQINIDDLVAEVDKKMQIAKD